jgi:hypothetical protein
VRVLNFLPSKPNVDIVASTITTHTIQPTTPHLPLITSTTFPLLDPSNYFAGRNSSSHPETCPALVASFPHPPIMSAIWQEAKAQDGKIYYYNVQTKVTQWTKPVELMSPAEVRTSPIKTSCANQLTLRCRERCRICHGKSTRLPMEDLTGMRHTISPLPRVPLVSPSSPC